ncbi:ArnT family glycosyltransferase [Planctomicrobium piriforme]|uniref:Dolichyl-phosphate-mannose-protein mannosyltransferase n=1 Tax=Planctomicrobium piriforme TaxID=1576369 RepID=A0A1I3JXA1_9PLAN|nr:glycosyltransferase family 39 protein [Planctomicrobium piriforme]SFI64882.1 Dolichyl-phosphate-mannose-protein mannosyltransferase [Planctomicrobium piriforme]
MQFPLISLRGWTVFDNSKATACLVVVLLFTHAGLLAYSATRHSPTMNEPGHLVAGLSHWKFGRFEIYRVNPPLTHFVAAIPVIIAGYNEDWSGFYDSPGARPEFKMGEDFVRANGERSIWLFTIARWACIPFSLIGGLFCFFWSRELWGSNLAGLISLFLWCFEPNILAHGELVTPDCAASAFGLGACYLFWRWLRVPGWGRAGAVGAMLGLAELTKTSWIMLFGLWPLLWLCWLWTEHRSRISASQIPPTDSPRPCTQGRGAGGEGSNDQAARLVSHTSSVLTQFTQLVGILLLGLYVLNLGYGFDGSFTRLKDFTFVSKAFTGLKEAGDPGNRFHASVLGNLPVPFPKQYLRGVDLQKKDFEHYGQPSYLRGEWKQGGWWYYYLYGLAVKTPHGSQAILLLSFVTLAVYWHRSRSTPGGEARFIPSASHVRPRDLLALSLAPLTLLVLVSSQLEFNHHVRYVLPVLGFAYVFAGVTAFWFRPRRTAVG